MLYKNSYFIDGYHKLDENTTLYLWHHLGLASESMDGEGHSRTRYTKLLKLEFTSSRGKVDKPVLTHEIRGLGMGFTSKMLNEKWRHDTDWQYVMTCFIIIIIYENFYIA